MIQINYRTEWCVARLTGLLDDEAAIALVEGCDRAVFDYAYRALTIEIASPGGLANAIEFVLEAMGRWRECGTKINTRALTQAGSAAALLLSAGDRRSAGPNAIMLFHRCAGGRDDNETPHELEEIDQRALKRLAQRAQGRLLGEGCSDLVTKGRDLIVAHHLVGTEQEANEDSATAVLGLYSDDEKRRDLCNRLQHRLALTRGKVDALKTLYAELFDINEWISAPLALALGLIDTVETIAIGDTVRSDHRPAEAETIAVPEWSDIYAGGVVPTAMLRRHVMCFGESGSGKTRSGVLPVLRGALSTPQVSTLLVIDPKGDLLSALQRMTPGEGKGMTIVPIDPERSSINVMVGDEWSIETLLEDRSWMQAAKRIILRTASFVPGHPAQILDGVSNVNVRDPYWYREGAMLAQGLLAFTLWWLSQPEVGATQLTAALSAVKPPSGEDTPSKEELAQRKVLTERFAVTLQCTLALEAVADRFGIARKETLWTVFAKEEMAIKVPDGVIAYAWLECGARRANAQAFDAWLRSPEEPANQPAHRKERARHLPSTAAQATYPNVVAIAAALGEAIGQPSQGTTMQVLKESVRWISEDSAGEAQACAEVLTRFVTLGKQALNTYACLWPHAAHCWVPAATSPMREQIHFGCEARDPHRSQPDFSDAVRAGPGDKRHCYVYSDAQALHDPFLGRTIKAAFFEAVLRDPSRRVSGHQRPTVGYVCDEFQRFITADPVHGEASFLEVARSYGAFAVFATQSIAGLELAMNHIGTGNNAAIDVILGNTATKVFFRSTDPRLQRCAEGLCPAVPNGPSMLALRPLPTLRAGECYAAIPDGRMVRAEISYTKETSGAADASGG